MEGEAAFRLAEKLKQSGKTVQWIIADRDGRIYNIMYLTLHIIGSIFKAFQVWFPNIQNIHCASHMMKNFLGLLYKADKKLGKKTHSMARMYNCETINFH
jgi:hypothetical protein